MKRIIIRNLLGTQTHSAEMDDPQAWIDACVGQNVWGKPERWIPASEPHDPADVIESENREVQPAIDAVLDEEGEELSPAIPAITEEWVKLRAEYTVSVIDLKEDAEWLLQECHRKRLMEYPSLGEFADAFVKLHSGDSSQMDEYVAKCLAVKEKNPKPE